MARALALLLAAFLAACAPHLQPPGQAVDAPRLAGQALIAADGAKLGLRIWLPQGRPKAVVVALHGFNDYANAFDKPARFWAERGVATYAYDQRGFGHSPHRGLWPGIAAMTDDLKAATRLVAARHPGIPLYLVGESMGGAVVMVTLTGDDPPEAEGAILVAPAVWGREHMNMLERTALWVFAHTVPWLRVSGRGLGIRPSDNIEMLRRLSRDPLVIKKTRVDAIHGLVDLMDAAFAAAPSLDGRTLILYGDRDEVVPGAATNEMTRRLPQSATPRQRLGVYPHGFHMLLRDLHAETVLADIAAWMDDASAPLPSGADERAREWLAKR